MVKCGAFIVKRYSTYLYKLSDCVTGRAVTPPYMDHASVLFRCLRYIYIYAQARISFIFLIYYAMDINVSRYGTIYLSSCKCLWF